MQSSQHSKSSSARVIGGTEVPSANIYPFFTALDGCGASLIAPHVVLTAAHCVAYRHGIVGSPVVVKAYDMKVVRDILYNSNSSPVDSNAHYRRIIKKYLYIRATTIGVFAMILQY